jgi:uncharacterized protein (DUF697 family)/tellurite resistance protein
MAINQQEALSCVKLLVCIARADREFADEERQALGDAFGGLTLPSGITADGLIGGEYAVDALIADIKSQDGRDAAYSACFTMAYADGKYHPEEQVILEKLEKAWEVPKEKKGLFGRIFQETKDTVSFTAIKPIADPKKREAEINEDVMKYSILAGTLGLFPIPIAKLATELAVVGVMGKMVRDIGQYWGRETNKEGVKQLLAGMGAGQAGRIAVNTLLGFIPGIGSVVPAATNFAATWAVGRVANQYYAVGGKMDAKTLRDAFRLRQGEGREAYEKHKATIQARANANKVSLDKLATEYKAGKITQADYERRVLELR